jgi:hypothetical protein
MSYIAFDANTEASPVSRTGGNRAIHGDFAMTIEILHLTAQIQSWLNRRIARHLEEQAERLAR